MIKKEILEYIKKLIKCDIDETTLIVDKLTLHLYMNLMEIEKILSKKEANLLSELKKIDKILHPAEVYHPVSPGHYCVPDFDNIQFYCGMTPDNRYWTMDFDGEKQLYHLWDYVYRTPVKHIEKHIKRNLKRYIYQDTKKLRFLT